MISITVGRDAATRKLKIVSGKSTMLVGDAGSVPLSVSRRHVTITIDDNDKITVKNEHPDRNTLHVNGGPNVMQRQVSDTDVLVLGEEGYSVKVKDVIRHFVKEKVDISHLEAVWNDYRASILKRQKKAHAINMARTISSTLSILAIACGVLFQGELINVSKTLYIIIVVITLIATFCTFIFTSPPAKNEELQTKFSEDYSCPKCGMPFGNMAYKHLRKKGKCSYCGVSFK